MVAEDQSVGQADRMISYRIKKDSARPVVTSKYVIQGFVSSGTYGRVYKAVGSQPVDGKTKPFAIKKFKPEKDGETIVSYHGISQSAVREIAVRRIKEQVAFLADER